MIVEQIQDLVVNVVKIQLGGGVRKTHLYTKPYTKRVDAICMPRGYQPPKFHNLIRRATQNNMWHVLSRHATMLARTTT